MILNLQAKQILMFPLLALALMPALFALYFTIQLKITQHEAREKLEESLLQTIYLKQVDFSWVKKGKEIRIGNRLFDIKIIKETKGGFLITGLYDEQEDLLHQQFKNINKEEKHTTQNKLCDFFFHFYYSTPPPGGDEFILSTLKTIYTDYYSLKLPSPFKGEFSPPPNLV